MKVVSLFQTDDGKTFETKEEARQHEIEVEAVNKLKTVLASSINTGRVEAVLKHLVVEYAVVRAILSNYGLRLPRKKDSVEGQ